MRVRVSAGINNMVVRFCTERYGDGTDKSNVFAHLTNYSLNKKSTKFTLSGENLM